MTEFRKWLPWSLMSSMGQAKRDATVLPRNAFASTHLEQQFVATKIYLLRVHVAACIKGPTKSRPHFWNGSSCRTGWCGIPATSVGCPNSWHRSHYLQYRYASFCVVGNHKPACHIFLAVTSPTYYLPAVLQWASRKTASFSSWRIPRRQIPSLPLW